MDLLNDMQDFSLEYGRFRFLLRSAGEAVLLFYKGSALRGVLGKSFRKIACHSRQKSCTGCMFLTRCAYAYVFETNLYSIPNEVGQFYVPRPYIIEPHLDGRERYGPGDSLMFDLLLFGHGPDYLPNFILSFQEVGSMGVGAGRHPFYLESVGQHLGDKLETTWQCGESFLQPPVPENLSVCLKPGAGISNREMKMELKMPVRLVFGGQMVFTLTFAAYHAGLVPHDRLSCKSPWGNAVGAAFPGAAATCGKNPSG